MFVIIKVSESKGQAGGDPIRLYHLVVAVVHPDKPQSTDVHTPRCWLPAMAQDARPRHGWHQLALHNIAMGNLWETPDFPTNHMNEN